MMNNAAITTRRRALIAGTGGGVRVMKRFSWCRHTAFPSKCDVGAAAPMSGSVVIRARTRGLGARGVRLSICGGGPDSGGDAFDDPIQVLERVVEVVHSLRGIVF